MEEKSKILVIGSTGYMGKYMVDASVRLGHPTFALIRDATAAEVGTAKAKLIESFRNSGVTLLYGDIHDHKRLMEAIKKVDVVITCVGNMSHEELLSQAKIIAAIKEAGTIKRYFPSEFGIDADRINIMEPAKAYFDIKLRIREMTKKEGIPYTLVSNTFAAAACPLFWSIGQVEPEGPPTDTISILGDGNSKVVFVKEEDIATCTIKAADDPRAMNKILYIRPPGNMVSQNDLLSLWERKTGRTFERIYVSEEEIVKKIPESPSPLNFTYAIALSIFVKGEMTNFDIDPSVAVEATELYPEIRRTTVDELLDQRIWIEKINWATMEIARGDDVIF